MELELTTSVVIGTDCTDSYKSNYHMIMTTTAPIKIWGIFVISSLISFLTMHNFFLLDCLHLKYSLNSPFFCKLCSLFWFHQFPETLSNSLHIYVMVPVYVVNNNILAHMGSPWFLWKVRVVFIFVCLRSVSCTQCFLTVSLGCPFLIALLVLLYSYCTMCELLSKNNLKRHFQ